MTKRKPTKKTKPAKPLPLAKEIAISLHIEAPQPPKATIDLIPAVNWGRP